MSALRLKTRLALALVACLLILSGLGALVARENLAEVQAQHAADDAATRVHGMARMTDARLLSLSQQTKAAADAAAYEDPDEILERMARMGLGTAVVLGKDNALLAKGGDASWNASLAALMASRAPPPTYASHLFEVGDGWFTVAARSSNLDRVVVGAMSHDYMSDSYLVDVLIHQTSPQLIVRSDGSVVAASNLPDGFTAEAVIGGGNRTTLGDETYLVQRTPLVNMDADVVSLVPLSLISDRVDALTWRFLLTSSLAYVAAIGVTVAIVSFTLKPLDRITEGARRLGQGAEKLDLKVRSKTELGVLANALEESAAEIAEARRRQERHAHESRLAAETFQLAMGDLSRSVGEASTRPEVAQRLTEALLRVAPVRAAAVVHEDSLLHVAVAPGHDADAASVEALVASTPSAFRWFDHGSGEDRLRIALLPMQDRVLQEADERKVGLLGSQAGVAMHRARATQHLRQAHDRLDGLVNQKQMFLDILSHDLKNPLAIARGRIELMQTRQPEMAERLAPVEKSLDRAVSLIEEAILFSRLERDSEIERPRTDVVAYAQDAAAALTPLAAQKNLEILVEADDAYVCPANKLVGRALENLLSNAIKWSPSEGSVELRVDRDDEHCRIHIIDHGPGIPPEDRGKLFARFQRVDRSGVKGTGLGLAIAHRVVQMHGGRITIEDTPGGGCTFVIMLPLGESENPSQPAYREQVQEVKNDSDR